MNQKSDNSFTVVVTEKEKKLLELIRSLGFGEIHVHIADQQPVRVEEIKKSIKL